MMKNTLKTLSRFAVCLMMIGAVACSDDEPGGGGPGGGEGGGGEGEGGGPSTPELTEGISAEGCIVSNFYIKSQPQVLHLLIIRVLHPYVPRKSDVRRTEEVDSMQFFRSAKQIYQKNSSC